MTHSAPLQPLQALHLLGAAAEGQDDTAWYRLDPDATLVERKPPVAAQLAEPDEDVIIEVVGVWDAASAAPYTLLIG